MLDVVEVVFEALAGRDRRGLAEHRAHLLRVHTHIGGEEFCFSSRESAGVSGAITNERNVTSTASLPANWLSAFSKRRFPMKHQGQEISAQMSTVIAVIFGSCPHLLPNGAR